MHMHSTQKTDCHSQSSGERTCWYISSVQIQACWAPYQDSILMHHAVSALLFCLQRHLLLAKFEGSIACSVCVLTREPHNALQWAQIYLFFTFVQISISYCNNNFYRNKPQACVREIFWSCKKKNRKYHFSLSKILC